MAMIFNIFCWALTVFVVLGNGFVVYLIALKRTLHTKPNWFVLSLAIADFLVGVTYVPVDEFCPFGSCTQRHIHWLFIDVYLCASVTNLCLMTTDRYLAIVKPLQYLNLITTRKVLVVIFMAWIIPVLTAIIPIVWTYTASKDSMGVIWEVFTVCILAVFGALPCIYLPLALVPILRIVRRCRSHWSTVNAQLSFNYPDSSSGKCSSKLRELSSAKVIITVVSLYETCHLISGCVRIMIVFGDRVPQVLKDLSFALILINSAANPVAYALLKGDIKQQLRKMYRGSWLWNLHRNVSMYVSKDEPPGRYNYVC